MSTLPKPITDWTEIYYQAIEDYFWEPSLFSRKPTEQSKSWAHWKAGLQSKEVPLNHLLSLFFSLVPQETVDHVLTGLTGGEARGFRLVSEQSGTQDLKGTHTQPDFVFASDDELLFLEMKVGSPSSVDQFVKYALSAETLCRIHPVLRRARLGFLVVDSTFRKVFGGQIQDERALRDAAARCVRVDAGPLKQPGIVSYLKESTAEDRARLAQRIDSIELSIQTYAQLGSLLSTHRAPDPTSARVIAGVVDELRRRGLVTP